MYPCPQVPRSMHIHPCGAASYTWGPACLPCWPSFTTRLSSYKGRDCLYLLHPPLHRVPCPLWALGGRCAGGWVSADKGGSEAGPAWCEVWWSGTGWVVLSAGWWIWKGVVLWEPTLLPRSRSPRKPIDSLRDSRSLSYSPVERRRPSPQPSPRDQQSSERVSRRGQRGDSHSPGHKRRRETPSPRPMRHRSSRSP